MNTTHQPATTVAEPTTAPPAPDLGWLQANLIPDEIEWKIQTAKNGKTLVVPYIDNRAVMERLDKAFGLAGWHSHFVEVNGGFLCSLIVTINDREVTKTDGANRTDIEPVKGGISDAMKRCAVQLGIGRGLYNYPKVYLEGEHRFIPDWGTTLLERLVGAFNGGRLEKPMYFLKEADAQRPSQK